MRGPAPRAGQPCPAVMVTSLCNHTVVLHVKACNLTSQTMLPYLLCLLLQCTVDCNMSDQDHSLC